MEDPGGDREERIREIERRLAKLDELLAKYIDCTMAYDMNNPCAMTESELQF
jgi:hypothetical protein